MNTATSTTEELVNREYRYGFVTDIETDTVPRGLNEDIIRLISAKKNEPNFMLDWRMKAYCISAQAAATAPRSDPQLRQIVRIRCRGR